MTPTAAPRRAALAVLLVLAACSGSTDLYAGLSERDANEIAAALNDHGVEAQKQSAGKQLFAVKVPSKDFSRAVAVLQAAGLPRNAFSRMGEVFKKDGMISSPTEERARFLYALSQELENTLTQIDGVVTARVHPVLPERVVPGEPVLPSSCSILIKHVPGWETAAYEPKIRKLVLASIPGLAEAPDKVAVIFVPAETATALAAGKPAPTGDRRPTPSMKSEPSMQPPQGERMSGSLGSAAWTGWITGVVALLLGIGGPSAWLWWKRREAARRRSAGETVMADGPQNRVDGGRGAGGRDAGGLDAAAASARPAAPAAVTSGPQS